MAEDPELVEWINQATVPVRIDVTEYFPSYLPALSEWGESFGRIPWLHYGYGWFTMIDSQGQHNFGVSGCQCVSHMVDKHPYNDVSEQAHRFYDRFQSAKAMANDSAGLAALRASVDREMVESAHCNVDGRLSTARYLVNHGAVPWPGVIELLKFPEPGEEDNLVPGIRELSIQSLGEFISDDSPFEPWAAEHVEAFYRHVNKTERERLYAEARARADRMGIEFSPASLPVPPSLRIRAARALGIVTGQNWSEKGDALVDRARVFWKEHADDSLYAPRETHRWSAAR